MDDRERHGADSWTAAIYTTNNVGNCDLAASGVLIDERRILTCAHVVGRFDKETCWVEDREVRIAFPKSEGDPGMLLPVQHVAFPASRTQEDDLAVLHFTGPLPAGVGPAPLRCPGQDEMRSRQWRALGFPSDSIGESASGTVGAALGKGWIRLDWMSGDPLQKGFSGSGVWSAEYQAVVAVVTQSVTDGGTQAGDPGGRAITLRQANVCLPGETLDGLAWWSLAHDAEAEQHWEPRARGDSTGNDSRSRFRGRETALREITKWLDRDLASRHVMVVTGAPGAGKSAVLARIVTTADSGRAGEFPSSDGGIRATAGSVRCAVHAKSKTALEVATELARAASAGLPERVEEFIPALRRALAQRCISRGGSRPKPARFNVIIDALDEASTPEEAHAIIREIILPMAQKCADVGAQVVVGTRRTDAAGDSLLGKFGSSIKLVDLDDEHFFARKDLEDYALATLQLADRQGNGNPYADDKIARPVARRIAELSKRNFLVAGLTAREHGLFDEAPVDPESLSFSPDVSNAMREYLSRIPDVEGLPKPADLLTALAFAEAPGFPVGLWGTAVRALGYGDVPESKLRGFARSQTASFVVESSGEDRQGSVFRLFHQALNDALLDVGGSSRITQEEGEQELTRAFLDAGRDMGWAHAPVYLLRSLPAHAARGQLVDDLLADDVYLLHSDLRRVLQVADQAVSSPARDRARLLGLTPEAVPADSPERAAMFSVTEAMDGLGTAYRAGRWPASYCAQWSVTAPSRENLTLRGHRGWVRAVCAVRAGDRTLLAVGGTDGVVRLWDPVDGSQVRVLGGGQGGVWALCTVQVESWTLLAVGGTDGVVRLWDPVDGSQVRVLGGGQGGVVVAVCAVQARDRTLLAAVGGYDKVVRLWDPAGGSQVRVLDVPQGWVKAVCGVQVEGRTLLAAGSGNGVVRLWDPVDGSLVRVLEGPKDIVEAVCGVQVGGRTLLAVGCGYGLVRLWDPVDGSLVRVLDADQGGVWAVCEVQAGGRTLLAAAVGSDRTVRLWDPADGSQVRILEGHQDIVKTMCAVQAGDRTLLATAGDYEGTVRLWDLSTASPDEEAQAHESGVLALCGVQVGDRTLLAVGGTDGAVRLRDPVDGSQVRVLDAGQGGVWAVCEVQAGRRTLLASVGGYDGAVRLWDPVDGSQVRVLDVHQVRVVEGPQDIVKTVCAVQAGRRTLLATVGEIDTAVRLWDPVEGSQLRVPEDYWGGWRAVCGVQVGDRTLLAAGGYDGTVRLWDLADGSQVRVLEGHQDIVASVCAVQAGDRTLLAAGGYDGTVRLWDLADGFQVRVLEGHQGEVVSVCAVQAGDRTLLATADSEDKTVRLWDPVDGRCELTVPVHYAVSAMASVADSLAVGLATGVIAINFGSGCPR